MKVYTWLPAKKSLLRQLSFCRARTLLSFSRPSQSVLLGFWMALSLVKFKI